MKKRLFIRAWELYRENKGSLFSECLRESWNEYKLNKNKGEEETMKTFKIKDWFYNKEFTGGLFNVTEEYKKKCAVNFCNLAEVFEESDIIKETEKAVYVELKTEVETKEVSKKVWIPKSQIEEINNYGTFDYFKQKYNSCQILKSVTGKEEYKIEQPTAIDSRIDIYKISLVADFEKIRQEKLQNGLRVNEWKAVDKKNKDNYFLLNITCL